MPLCRPAGVCGRTIIFTETKNDANELAGALSELVGARALHGDIPQAQREVTLNGFRSGAAPGARGGAGASGGARCAARRAAELPPAVAAARLPPCRR